MANVKELQAAHLGEPIEKLGDDPLPMPLLPVRLEVEHSWFHWKEVRELAEKAKMHGYATRVVDGAFFYAVTYTNSPTVYPWSDGVVMPYANEITEDARKAFPLCADAEKDVICFHSTWDYLFGNVPASVRPFFRYKLPADMRLDIMWRRLSIVVYINIGKIVEALEKIGISARVPKSQIELNELFIPFTYQAALPDGSVINIRGGNLNNIATKVAFEFMSLEGFTESVSQTIKALIEVTKARLDVEGQSVTE